MILNILAAGMKREIKEKGLMGFFYVFLEFLLGALNSSKHKIVRTIYSVYSPLLVCDINGSKMNIDLRKKGIYEELFANRKREVFLTIVMLNAHLLKEGDTALDIGANIGYYALIESKLVGASGKVYAVEPVSDNIKSLEKNVKLNNYTNIEIFHMGMSDQDGVSTVYVSDRPNWSSMMKDRTPGEVIRTEPVPISTVDTFLKGKKVPNLIRMDVEGYEYNIVKGMKETLKRNVTVLLEFHEFNLTKEQIIEFFDIFEKNDFYVKFSIIDVNEDPGKMRRYLLKKAGKKIGFLDYDSKTLRDALISRKCSNPHICFVKKTADNN